MEMIRLRTTDFQEKQVEDLLHEAINQAKGEDGLVHLRVYGNMCLRTDVTVTMVWDTQGPQGKGSRAGLAMTETLGTFGLVEHSIWTEKLAPHDAMCSYVPGR
jgi:hypothetical protein